MFVRGQIRQLKIIHTVLIRIMLLTLSIQIFQYLKIVFRHKIIFWNFQLITWFINIYESANFVFLEILSFHFLMNVVCFLFLTQYSFESAFLLFRLIVEPLGNPPLDSKNFLFSTLYRILKHPHNKVANPPIPGPGNKHIIFIHHPLNSDIPERKPLPMLQEVECLGDSFG